MRAVAEQGRDSLLEDYVLLFRTAKVADLCAWSPDKFRDALYDEIASQVQIARNMGFATD
ncbi:MAG: hypothetical protein N2508_01640 [Anaerolineae bacterium]|nr:hypothetical protein [Anaerolineae bacterium]